MSEQYQNDNSEPQAEQPPATGAEPCRPDSVDPGVPDEHCSTAESGESHAPDVAPDDHRRLGDGKEDCDPTEQEIHAARFDGLIDVPPPILHGRIVALDGRDRILLAPENFDINIAKALTALGEHRDAYERGGKIVGIAKKRSKTSSGKISSSPLIQLLTANNVREQLSRRVVFQRPSPPLKGSDDGDGVKITTAPREICEAIIERTSYEELPVLRSITFAPTLRRDGSILQSSGYDEQTGLFADIDGDFEFQSPPTRDDALAALKLLCEVFSGFPFVTDLDRAIAIAACLAVVMTPVLDTKPAIGISAPVASSGKGYLIRMLVVLATGRLVSPMGAGKSDEEMVKHLDAKLLKGDPIIAIDNITRPLGGDRLCTLVSEPISSVRPLGASLVVDVPNAQLFANGNSLTAIGDMCRRILILTLDPRVERPELREFEFNALAEIYEHRQKYLRAVLTILLAHRHAAPAAGRKHWPPLGSFERWSKVVRDPLMWLGLPNVVDALEKNRANDPTLQQRVTVLTTIADVIAFGAKFTTPELISLAIRQHGAAVTGTPPAGGPLREALLGAVGHGSE